MEKFDREKKEYLKRREALNQMLYACAEETQDCAGYAPGRAVRGSSGSFQKVLEDNSSPFMKS